MLGYWEMIGALLPLLAITVHTLDEVVQDLSQSKEEQLQYTHFRLSIPRLTLSITEKDSSPYIQCVSDISPNPTITWFSSPETSGNGFPGDKYKGNQIQSNSFVNKALICCASNANGKLCSQLYDYDLSVKGMKSEEAPEILLSPGDSLLLRCSLPFDPVQTPVWKIDGKEVEYYREPRHPEDIGAQTDNHAGVLQAFLSIQSVQVNHSGTYICTDQQSNSKLVSVRVQAETFLRVHLDQNKTISAAKADSFCMQADVSSHPLAHCAWEDPDGNFVQCQRLSWKNSIVKLCGQQKSGEYRLHLEAGQQSVTKITSLCVADEPKINCSYAQRDVVCETMSTLPANLSWELCPTPTALYNCEKNSLAWKYVQHHTEEDSGLLCKKSIVSSLSAALVNNNSFARFCLNNSFGSWCGDDHFLSATSQALRGHASTHSGSSVELRVGIVVLLLALITTGMLLLYTVKKNKPHYQSQLQMIQMVGPNDNDYIYINFKDFQYDQKWEFPRENLELGKELGSGAFGMVVHATAFGIANPGVSQQVAVKMLKEKHQTVEMEALMSELKMMTQVGNHNNIVNLLGACTGSGPVYLIFQYCCYGDLLNYLKNNRERYHKSLTDAFNKDRFSSLYHNLQSERGSGLRSDLQRPADNYTHVSHAATGGQENLPLLALNSSPTDTTVGFSEESGEQLEALTYSDLLSFSYQVAMGMKFLSSRNCIHRDLAARNVMVTKGRLVKIGDFGLARDIDNDSNYVVRGNVRLPVKWMAPESIFQGIYTIKSDVWAFGILLWEIFSLGVTPYPGVKVDNKFYFMIERGFKMECPYYARDSVYRIMCKCWDLEPCNRPPFCKLVQFMDDQLTNMEEKLYDKTPEQSSDDYQNAAAILTSTKEEENQGPSLNDYCQAPVPE